MPDQPILEQVFEQVDGRLRALEQALRERSSPSLSVLIDDSLDLVRQLLRAHLASRTEAVPAGADGDILELFKQFVRGDPSLNAVRDNIRELVYYRNCIDMNREDALPARPDAMAVRTVRHIYLYLHSRWEQQPRPARN